MTEDEARRILLSFEGATEGEHHGHPDFRVGKSIFATLSPNREHTVLRLPYAFAESLASEDPKNRRVVNKPGDWGWLSIALESIAPEDYESFAREAWSALARKPK